MLFFRHNSRRVALVSGIVLVYHGSLFVTCGTLIQEALTGSQIIRFSHTSLKFVSWKWYFSELVMERLEDAVNGNGVQEAKG